MSGGVSGKGVGPLCVPLGWMGGGRGGQGQGQGMGGGGQNGLEYRSDRKPLSRLPVLYNLRRYFFLRPFVILFICSVCYC